MWDFLSPFNQSDLVHGLNVWRQTTVNAKDLSLYHCSNSQVVKHLCAVLPRVGIAILSDSFIVEAVNSGNLTGLVVASQQSYESWIL